MRCLFGVIIAAILSCCTLYATVDHDDPHYPFKTITIQNETLIPFIIGYRRTDPGFRGRHVTVPAQERVKGNRTVHIHACTAQQTAGAQLTLMSTKHPAIQTEIAARHQDIIRIIAHTRSDFEICNATGTLQLFIQASPEETDDSNPSLSSR